MAMYGRAFRFGTVFRRKPATRLRQTIIRNLTGRPQNETARRPGPVATGGRAVSKTEFSGTRASAHQKGVHVLFDSSLHLGRTSLSCVRFGLFSLLRRGPLHLRRPGAQALALLLLKANRVRVAGLARARGDLAESRVIPALFHSLARLSQNAPRHLSDLFEFRLYVRRLRHSFRLPLSQRKLARKNLHGCKKSE